MTPNRDKGKFLYLDDKSYKDKITEDQNSTQFVEEINYKIEKSKEILIKRYNGQLQKIPIWEAVEVLGFSTLSKMYANWKDTELVKNLSCSFETFQGYGKATGIIRALSDLRNLCAHQARIWNKALIAQIPKRKLKKDKNHSHDILLLKTINVLTKLVDEINQDENIYSKKVRELCTRNKEFEDGLVNPSLPAKK